MRVRCPYCDKSEDEHCEHLIADWAGGYWGMEFTNSPFSGAALPHIVVEEDSPAILCDVEPEMLGPFSDVLDAYPDGLFEPPRPVGLFLSLLNMISTPTRGVTRPEPGMAGVGGHVFCFASDPVAAKAEISAALEALEARLRDLASEMTVQAVATRGETQDTEVVYGTIKESLVFIEASRAAELCVRMGALRLSRTWGEFRSRLGQDAYAEVVKDLSGGWTFDEFWEELRTSDPQVTLDSAKRDYLAEAFGRFREDSEPFDMFHIPAVLNGNWPGFPSQEMCGWVPREIQKKYGSEESCGSGTYLTFSPGYERALVAAFALAGYRCVRDQKVVELACGYVRWSR